MSKYPSNWREIKSADGTVERHDRVCGGYRVIPGLKQYHCYQVAPDGFTLREIGSKTGLSAAMAHCRLHLDYEAMQTSKQLRAMVPLFSRSDPQGAEVKCFHPMCSDRSALFRLNAKGQPGVWACKKHLANTDAKVDPVVKQVVDAVSRRAPR